MTEKTLAEIPLSVFEYRATFQEPIFAAFERPAIVAEALYRSLREWNVAFENISWKALPVNANDLQIVCELFNKRVTFTVMLGAVSVLVTNPSWSEAALIEAIVRNGLIAVQAGTNSITKEQGVTLALHLKPQGKSTEEVTARFRAIPSGPGIDKDLKAFGFSVYGRNALVSGGKRPDGPTVRGQRDRGATRVGRSSFVTWIRQAEVVQLESAGKNKETASCLMSPARRSRTLLK